MLKESNPITDAVCDNDVAQVEYLLLSGADPNFVEDVGGVTLLHHAAQRANAIIAEMLILAGADVFARTPYDNMAPLEIACLHENWEVATLLAHFHYLLFSIAWVTISSKQERNCKA